MLWVCVWRSETHFKPVLEEKMCFVCWLWRIFQNTSTGWIWWECWSGAAGPEFKTLDTALMCSACCCRGFRNSCPKNALKGTYVWRSGSDFKVVTGQDHVFCVLLSTFSKKLFERVMSGALVWCSAPISNFAQATLMCVLLSRLRISQQKN
jgi:hypothetical protein